MEENLSSYDYILPSHLIATKPLYPKHSAKLLVYDKSKDSIIHTTFKEFFNFIPKDCLIVLNDTKVLKARIYGAKESGAKIELLYHKALDNGFLVQIKGRVKIDDILIFPNDLKCKILSLLDNGLRIVEFYQFDKKINKIELFKILESIGHIPLPPYIKRSDNQNDVMDYQSVFALNLGSIAAPTASLHFSDDDMQKIKSLNHCFVTLHIGAGTFFGVESSNIKEHKMHKESFFISQDSKNKIDNANKIFCIGTTATRCIEHYARSKTAYDSNKFQSQNSTLSGECDIFLNPFNKPIKTDYLLTNFHLPKSSLIMLVASFIGLNKTKEIYEIAKKLEYRFYSYGDGMLII